MEYDLEGKLKELVGDKHGWATRSAEKFGVSRMTIHRALTDGPSEKLKAEVEGCFTQEIILEDKRDISCFAGKFITGQPADTRRRAGIVAEIAVTHIADPVIIVFAEAVKKKGEQLFYTFRVKGDKKAKGFDAAFSEAKDRAKVAIQDIQRAESANEHVKARIATSERTGAGVESTYIDDKLAVSVIDEGNLEKFIQGLDDTISAWHERSRMLPAAEREAFIDGVTTGRAEETHKLALRVNQGRQSSIEYLHVISTMDQLAPTHGWARQVMSAVDRKVARVDTNRGGQALDEREEMDRAILRATRALDKLDRQG